ncbi:MAG: ADP-ribosylglycohydrolase family protein [Bifidobacteriaceae bacterium]|jgi:ADP-ribosylglycohydrolase|nr:ADP-ribosylglycohydrolase family protein [Bifidobacteriaceae bacterium]
MGVLTHNRAAGVLLGQAIGDALGVPYEFGQHPIQPGEARMIGGGLGHYRPGEWSDDTQMALCVAQAAAGADLTSPEGLGEVAKWFLRWLESPPGDIGQLTARVLRGAEREVAGLPYRPEPAAIAKIMLRQSQEAAGGRSAGNGGLMRTAVVGLTALHDRDKVSDAARQVCALTHADQSCQESCVLWSEAVRVAVAEQRLDVRAGLDLLPAQARGYWEEKIAQAEAGDPGRFDRNGWTVTALQAAWSSIHATRALGDHPDRFAQPRHLARAIGHDTDTVAAIVGGLLGGYFGVSRIPANLARQVGGWPGGIRRSGLVQLALEISGGGWDQAGSMLAPWSKPLGTKHPHDPGVILGTERDLLRADELGFDAAVSLSRLGQADIAASGLDPALIAEFWLIDSDDPSANADLAWTLQDAARTVKALRDQGHRVLLHCVGAAHRTPSAALAYSHLLKAPADQAARAIEEAVGHPVSGLLWQTARGLTS